MQVALSNDSTPLTNITSHRLDQIHYSVAHNLKVATRERQNVNKFLNESMQWLNNRIWLSHNLYTCLVDQNPATRWHSRHSDTTTQHSSIHLWMRIWGESRRRWNNRLQPHLDDWDECLFPMLGWPISNASHSACLVSQWWALPTLLHSYIHAV